MKEEYPSAAKGGREESLYRRVGRLGIKSVNLAKSFLREDGNDKICLNKKECEEDLCIAH